MLRHGNSFAVVVASAGAVAAPVGTMVLLVVVSSGPRAGTGPYARPESLRLLALVTLLVAVPPVTGALLLGRGSLGGRLVWRRVATFVLAGVEGILVWKLWQHGGVAWAPAGVLTAAAAATPDRRRQPAPVVRSHGPSSPAPRLRMELLGAAAVATLAGAIGRAFVLSETRPETSSAFTIAVSGLVIFGWAPLAIVLLVPGIGRRLCLAAGLVTSLTVLAQPTGMQAGWFLPAGVLLVLAGATPPREVRLVPF